MSVARKIKGLQVQKDSELASFEILFEFMAEYNEQTSFAALKIRLEKLDKLHDELMSVFMNLQINDESPENVAAYLNEKTTCEKKYYRIKEFLVNKLDQDPLSLDRSHRSSNSLVVQQLVPKVQLPRITLPRFSGDIEEWLAFRDLYVALVYSSAELPTIEKYHYLRSQLDGEALNVISSLPLTPANYTVAWNLLTARYSNKKMLKRKQVQTLFELPELKRENARELHDFTDNFEKVIKTLDQIVEDADYKHLLMIHLLTTKSDTCTRRTWEEESSKRDTDTVTKLLESQI
nr:uncharacterized protein LOC115262282 [Aedes albopictus]